MRLFAITGSAGVALALTLALTGTVAAAGVPALPANVRAACEHSHLMPLCSGGGRYVTVNGRRVFRLTTTVGMGRRGPVAHSAALGPQSMRNHGTSLCASSLGKQNWWVVQEYCNGDGNQTWIIEYDGNEFWQLQNETTRQCWTNLDNDQQAYNQQVLRNCNFNGSVGWDEVYRLTQHTAGGWTGFTMTTDAATWWNGYCVSSEGWGLGYNIQTFNCNGSANQTFGND